MAALLSARLNGAFVINTDFIKEWLRLFAPSSELLYHSHDAWKLFGEKNEGNIIHGFEQHADALLTSIRDFLLHLFKKYRLIIIEGVHFSKNGIKVLVESDWEILPVLLGVDKIQYSNFVSRKAALRSVDGKSWLESFDVIEKLDNYYKNLALCFPDVFVPPTGQSMQTLLESTLDYFSGPLRVFR